jgi:putative aldouronate transport system substrate-binding protein
MAIRGNAFWRLNDFIPKLPNISQTDPELLRRGSLEGNIYGLSRDRAVGRLGMFYRKDWADRLGIPHPQTIEDLYEMARAFTHDDPTGTGRSTFGLTEGRTMGTGSFANLGAWFGAGAGGGPTRMFTLDSNNRVIPVFATDEFIASMNFSRRLFSEGLMNRDFITTANRTHNIVNGSAGIVMGPMDDAISALATLRRLEPDAEFAFVGALDAGHGLIASAENPGFKGYYAFSRTTLRTEEELMNALMFFDSMNTVEVNNLLEFGIEGLHYIVEDGVAVVTDEQFNAFRIQRHDLGQLRTFNLTMNQAIPRELTQIQKAVDDAITENNTRFVTGIENGLFSDTLARMGHTLQVEINDANARYIMGEIDEAGWRAAVARWFSAGGDRIVEELTASYERFLAHGD